MCRSLFWQRIALVPPTHNACNMPQIELRRWWSLYQSIRWLSDESLSVGYFKDAMHMCLCLRACVYPYVCVGEVGGSQLHLVRPHHMLAAKATICIWHNFTNSSMAEYQWCVAQFVQSFALDRVRTLLFVGLLTVWLVWCDLWTLTFVPSSGHLEVREQRDEHPSVQRSGPSLLAAQLHGRVHLVTPLCRRERLDPVIFGVGLSMCTFQMCWKWQKIAHSLHKVSMTEIHPPADRVAMQECLMQGGLVL